MGKIGSLPAADFWHHGAQRREMILRATEQELQTVPEPGGVVAKLSAPLSARWLGASRQAGVGAVTTPILFGPAGREGGASSAHFALFQSGKFRHSAKLIQ